ncbi:hypothetical protein KUTeg_001701 [Tegillarca granosa]|uniref:Uncharacterized protein n=1 Tax=Tegillarca granosa TaxID=220873 RepID=A0ABQ9FS75_TEGGR|nr:hypothetical protein KUTeg_001701 [Tegillarca granosa]
MFWRLILFFATFWIPVSSYWFFFDTFDFLSPQEYHALRMLFGYVVTLVTIVSPVLCQFGMGMGGGMGNFGLIGALFGSELGLPTPQDFHEQRGSCYRERGFCIDLRPPPPPPPPPPPENGQAAGTGGGGGGGGGEVEPPEMEGPAATTAPPPPPQPPTITIPPNEVPVTQAPPPPTYPPPQSSHPLNQQAAHGQGAGPTATWQQPDPAQTVAWQPPSQKDWLNKQTQGAPPTGVGGASYQQQQTWTQPQAGPVGPQPPPRQPPPRQPPQVPAQPARPPRPAQPPPHQWQRGPVAPQRPAPGPPYRGPSLPQRPPQTQYQPPPGLRRMMAPPQSQPQRPFTAVRPPPRPPVQQGQHPMAAPPRRGPSPTSQANAETSGPANEARAPKPPKQFSVKRMKRQAVAGGMGMGAGGMAPGQNFQYHKLYSHCHKVEANIGCSQLENRYNQRPSRRSIQTWSLYSLRAPCPPKPDVHMHMSCEWVPVVYINIYLFYKS